LRSVENFSAAAWILERRFPADFSRPEVQLNLIQQNNVTENHLSITISAEELREIESTAEPVRAKVMEMFAQYRPAAELGNGEPEKPVIPVEAEIKEPAIERKAGDEHKAEFWSQFTADRERLVERGTAEFVVRQIVSETIGPHRCGKIEFGQEIITVGTCLDSIDRLVGAGNPGGWRRLLAKAGVQPGPGA
jgi:hypothetical protein